MTLELSGWGQMASGNSRMGVLRILRGDIIELPRREPHEIALEYLEGDDR